MRKRILPPSRKLDSPWAVSQDVQMGRFGLLDYMCEEDFQMPPYPWQYVQNEILFPVAWANHSYHINLFKVSRIPCALGSVSATIYRGNTAIQTFWIKQSGEIEIKLLVQGEGQTPEIYVESLNFINITGSLELKWNGHPGHNHVVISYEYEYCNSVEYNGEPKNY